MSPIRALLLCLALLALPRPGMAESRLPLLDTRAHADWAAIGRLNRAGHRTRAMCSATLIAPDTVLTAAHCLRGANGRPVALKDLHFTAGWYRGTAVATSGITAVTLPPGAVTAGQTSPRHDLALLTLDTALRIPPLPLAGRDLPPLPYAIVAYEASRPHALGGRFDCPASLRGPLLLQTTCAVEQGASGGPVLGQVNGRWQVIGVISARAGGLTLIARIRGRGAQ